MSAQALASPETSPAAGSRLEALFREQAAKTPAAAAVLHRGQVLSYAELEAASDRLAADLAELGAGRGVLVGVCMRRTPWMIVALLGVLKAGAAYLPLDPAYPAERLDFMLGDSQAALLLTDCDAHAQLDFAGAVVGWGPADRALVLRPPLAATREDVAPQLLAPKALAPKSLAPKSLAPKSLAYVIYTSGSTGRPKGVMLGHTAVGMIEWARATFVGGELARVAATTSVCFDPSVFEIFAPICTGGVVVLKENALEPFAPDERPTMLNCVPSVLAGLCRARAVPSSVRVINIGGEPLKADFVREVYRRTRAEAVYNHYGPTEATTCTTVALVPRDVARDPPIGRPIGGAKVLVLDPAGRPVGAGQTGEIHIGGDGLALGYLNRPELTRERFVDSEWGRLYRTGDIGRWTADASLEFVGRVDEQVKIRGFRIELGEVEAALLRLPEVANAAVGAEPDARGQPQLVAYVQARRPLTLREVRARLGRQLPVHMQPARLVVLENFPLTLSGKLDRKALAAPAQPSVPRRERAEEMSRIEEAIGEIYQEVLGRQAVGPEESFFDLGGDSLAALNAALRLEEVLGYQIPSALIHQAASPRALAEALEHCVVHQPDHLSVLHTGEGAGTPLFCVADLFGRPLSYLSLSRRLAGERAVYGLSPGPLEAQFATQGDIAGLSGAYAAALSAHDGPLVIAGYSAAGVLAFDLARRLELAGRSVALVLLDSSLRARRPSPQAMLRWASRQSLDLLDPRSFRARLERAGQLRTKLVESLAPTPPRRPPHWVPADKAALAARMMQLCARYRPLPFHGPVLMVKSSERDRVDALLDHDGLLGWRGVFQGQARVVSAPGDHHAFMRDPHVSMVAAEIEAFLGALVGSQQPRGLSVV